MFNHLGMESVNSESQGGVGMRNFDFYEFVGIIVPGSALLISIGFLFKVDSVSFLLVPNSFGGLGAHVLIAYITGHLLQAIGNYIEYLYWKAWKGMPTDWPVSRAEACKFPGATEALLKLCQTESITKDLQVWRGLVAQARSAIYSKGHATRLQYFNGTYGMFRGIVADGFVVACLAWASQVDVKLVYPVIAVVVGISLNRMHSFAVHYANELFSSAKVLAPNKVGVGDESNGTESR